MQDILNHIKNSFNGRISIREKRSDIYQLFLPIYHEDGDMIDIFVTENDDKNYELNDFGLTLMRLSYSYEIDSPNKEAIFQKILGENQLSEEEGYIKFKTKPETIFTDIMHFSQTLAKVGSMRYFKREVVESLFYEMLEEYIQTELQEYKPRKNVLPIPNREDLPVDYQFTPNGHPIYLFGVKDYSKARLATISCLEYQRSNLNFRSFIVHQDSESLPKSERKRLTSACDKQFTSLDDFKENAEGFLKREKAVQ